MDKLLLFMRKWMESTLGITHSEEHVLSIKQDAVRRVDEVTHVLQKAGRLQTQVINRTTTYYLGKAAGVIK